VTYVWGRHPVFEALRAGRTVDRLVIAEGTRALGLLGEIIQTARERGVDVQFVDRRALDRLSDRANHQGIVAEVADFNYRTLDDLVAAGSSATVAPLVLVLDGLEDPQNLGTLIRSAEAVGATGVVIPVHRAVGVTPAVEKASAGAVEHLPIARVTNVVRSLVDLKQRGYWVIGLDPGGNQAYDQIRVDAPIALVVGAEGKGLGRLVRETCDALVRVPVRGRVGSLNAAVAGSIVLYDILRRRKSGA